MIRDAPGLLGAPIGAAVIVALLALIPFMLVTGLMLAWCSWLGWPSTRLRNVAVVVTIAYAVGLVLLAITSGWHAWTLGLHSAWSQGMRGVYAWKASTGFWALSSVPFAVLAAWAIRARVERNMLAASHPQRAQRFRARQQANARRSARMRARVEHTPVSRGGAVILGHLERSEAREVRLASHQITKRHPIWLSVLVDALNLHMTLVGGTGAGKTTLLARLTAGWAEVMWRRAEADGTTRGGDQQREPAGRPLVIMVNAKGGAAVKDDGLAWSDYMVRLGMSRRRVGVLPVDATLNMWRLPGDQLVEVLSVMAGTGQRFYDLMQRGLLRMVVNAPGQGVPRSSAEFLRRVSAGWLRTAWAGDRQQLDVIADMEQRGTLITDFLALQDLLTTVGAEFDGGRPLSDFDALYVTLEGTSQNRVASVKAKLLVELLKAELGSGERPVLFVFDEWSAVSEHVDIRQLIRTARGLGGSVLLAAQSWHGLGSSEAEVDEILADMRGGNLVMAGPDTEKWSKQCGTRQVMEVGGQLQGSRHSGMGTGRLQDEWIVSPDELRGQKAHEVTLIVPGEARMGRVIRLPGLKRQPASEVLRRHAAAPTEGPAVPQLQIVEERRQLAAAVSRGGA